MVTTRVEDPSQLHPDYTWLLQQEIDAVYDATVVYCCGRLWAIRLERAADRSWVDWRLIVDNHRPGHWNPMELPTAVEAGVRDFMRLLQGNFARLDFLIDSESRWWFLEANMNGQFAWLDLDNERELLSFVAARTEAPTE